MDAQRMKQMIDNYMQNKREIDRLLSNRDDPTHSEKRIRPTSNNGYSSLNKSVTERKAIRNVEFERMIAKVQKEINIVDVCVKHLEETEAKIINYLKYGDKITSIARVTGIERRKVARIRDKAIDKMVHYYNKNKKEGMK